MIVPPPGSPLRVVHAACSNCPASLYSHADTWAFVHAERHNHHVVITVYILYRRSIEAGS